LISMSEIMLAIVPIPRRKPGNFSTPMRNFLDRPRCVALFYTINQPERSGGAIEMRVVMTRMLIVLCTLLAMIGLSSAQDEEPTVTMLSCDGTTKVYVKRDESINPVTKMDVVVSLAERTVLFDNRVAHIDHIAARTIFFGGDSVKDTTGYIDGKTGVMTAMNIMNLSALPRLARSQGCTTSRRLTTARLKKRTSDLPMRESPPRRKR
jgi:hypothetical protein